MDLRIGTVAAHFRRQTGRHGTMRFFGSSKVVLPDGSTAAFTRDRAGMVHVDIDVAVTVRTARRVFHHLDERLPDRYARLACRPAPPQGLGDS